MVSLAHMLDLMIILVGTFHFVKDGWILNLSLWQHFVCTMYYMHPCVHRILYFGDNSFYVSIIPFLLVFLIENIGCVFLLFLCMAVDAI